MNWNTKLFTLTVLFLAVNVTGRLIKKLCVKWLINEKYYCLLGDTFERIVGGAYMPIESAPYQVSLIILKPYLKKLDLCGGSIISDRFIITAQHCFV